MRMSWFDQLFLAVDRREVFPDIIKHFEWDFWGSHCLFSRFCKFKLHSWSQGQGLVMWVNLSTMLLFMPFRVQVWPGHLLQMGYCCTSAPDAYFGETRTRTCHAVVYFTSTNWSGDHGEWHEMVSWKAYITELKIASIQMASLPPAA